MLDRNISKIKQSDEEIFLLGIIYFFQSAWKKLVLASIFGTLVGLLSWFLLINYSAEYVLINNNTNNNYALDISSWKMLQKNLPKLAAQIINENKVSKHQEGLYRDLADERWWQKNVTTSFVISKADTKDFAVVSKDLDAASSTILDLTITTKASSKDKCIEEAIAASQFLLSGAAYLQIRTLLNVYESQALSSEAELQQKITNTQIEMGYQIERAKSLEELYKRFPSAKSLSGQVLDTKDSGAKYLPLSTQIIAVNNDINASKESLMRLQKSLERMVYIRSFLNQAIPLQNQTFDGLSLVEDLLGVESELRTKFAKGGSNSQEFLDQLRFQLLAIQVRFTKGLEANTAPAVSKKGMIKTTMLSILAAFLLMVIILLAQKVWARNKSFDIE